MRKSKVVSSIFGGLGNQMFIYATARALALRMNCELALDSRTGFRYDKYNRKFELSNFKTEFSPANKLEAFDFISGSFFKRVSYKLNRHIPLVEMTVIKENDVEHYRKLFDQTINSFYLDGYWQSEKYFADYSDVIRKDFTIKNEMPQPVLEELSSIEKLGDRAVALCIRRYQEVEHFVNIKVLEKEYYQKAMELIYQRIENPVFICFSQDQEWVRNNLCKDHDIKFVAPKHNDNGAIEDLFLMQNFKNYIISNSTFYWWGAWLSKYKSKVVIAPNTWVNPSTPSKDWIVID